MSWAEWRRRSPTLLFVCLLAILTSCGDAGTSADSVVRVYTSVTQETVDAIVAEFEAANPEAEVEVFRAPTGELTARIATDLREGDIEADVLWLTDPLSIQQYDSDGLLREWAPDSVESIPESYRTSAFFGTRILNMVIIAGDGVVMTDWEDLLDESVVAIPDPSFAGSAFGALAYFALDERYGLEFLERLAANGAVQVNSPGDVVSGVAEGIYDAGITLDFSVRSALADGSPVQLVWPESGAIAIYSPIAVVASSSSGAAEAFVEYVLSQPGQATIGATGWEPVREDVPWDVGGPQVNVDWAGAFDRQEELLGGYRAIFEGE